VPEQRQREIPDLGGERETQGNVGVAGRSTEPGVGRQRSRFLSPFDMTMLGNGCFLFGVPRGEHFLAVRAAEPPSRIDFSAKAV